MNSNILKSIFNLIVKIMLIGIVFLVVFELNTFILSRPKTIGFGGEVNTEEVLESGIVEASVNTIFADETVNIPILLYNNFDDNKKNINKTTITPEKFAQHLDMMKALGFNTISFQELIDFVENAVPIKENPIIITFDDGYYSNYKYLQSILEKKNMKATVNLIVTHIDDKQTTNKKNESYLSWENVRKMKSSGLIEFAGHTYNMHQYDPNGRIGVRRKEGESDNVYLESLREDFTKMKDIILKETSSELSILAYPYGYHTEESEKICDDLAIKITMTMDESANFITKGSSLRLLNRYTIPGYISDEAMMNLLNIFLLDNKGL